VKKIGMGADVAKVKSACLAYSTSVKEKRRQKRLESKAQNAEADTTAEDMDVGMAEDDDDGEEGEDDDE
jgi:hypothetical protein